MRRWLGVGAGLWHDGVIAVGNPMALGLRVAELRRAGLESRFSRDILLSAISYGPS